MPRGVERVCAVSLGFWRREERNGRTVHVQLKL